jgi:sulfatase modifying factor 1
MSARAERLPAEGTPEAGGSAGTGQAAGRGGAASSGGTASSQGAATMGGAAGSGGVASVAGYGNAAGASGRATMGEAGTAAVGGGGEGASGGMVRNGGDGGMSGAGGGAPVPDDAPPSCAGLTGSECQGADCCASPIIPPGTDNSGVAVPGFRLDRYEVTVARFRNYMAAVEAWEEAGNPVVGAGAHPMIPESGWRSDWVGQLPSAIAVGIVPKWRGYPLQSAEPPFADGYPNYLISGADQLAVNNVPWHVAFAFCIWDGGRLPFRAEWFWVNGNAEQRSLYPWGPIGHPSEVLADRPEPSLITPYPDPFWPYIGIPVGSHPASAGSLGHQDLAAGLGEYVRDTTPGGLVQGTVLVQLGSDEDLGAMSRAHIEASWKYPASVQAKPAAGQGSGIIGFRCARDS